MTVRAAALALAVVLSSCATRADSGVDGRITLALVGAEILPMTGDPAEVLHDQTILIAGDAIAAIGPGSTTRAPPGVEVIDVSGRYVTPGLIDLHAHLEYGDDPDILKLFVAHGVTTVRSMDGRPNILDWRARVAAGALIGPGIVTAGPIIDGAPPLRDDNLSVADAESARAAVRTQAEAGYDFIKLYTNVSPEAFRAAVAEAASLGIPVTGHVPRALTVDDVVDHYWTIEHLSDLGEVVAQEGARLPWWASLSLAAPLDAARVDSYADALAAKDLVIVPTSIERDRSVGTAEMVAAWASEQPIRNLPADVVDYWRGAASRFAERMDAADWAMLREARRNRLALIRALHARGARLAVGTDTPNAFVAPGASVHQELANFVEAGLSPAEALRAATAVPGAALRRWRRVGVLEVGARADLLILSANPLEAVGALQQRVGVVVAGGFLSESELVELEDDMLD